MRMDIDAGTLGSDFEELQSEDEAPKKKKPATSAAKKKAPAPAKKAPAKHRGKKAVAVSSYSSLFDRLSTEWI